PIQHRPIPNDSFGKDIKDLWDVSGPWLMPLVPLALIVKEDDQILTRRSCVEADIESDIRFDRAEALKLQQASFPPAQRLDVQEWPTRELLHLMRPLTSAAQP